MADADDEDAHADALAARGCGLVEAQDLQLVRQVDPAHVDVVRHLQDGRGEVQDAAHARGDERVADVLRRLGRVGDDADAGALGAHDLVEVLERPDAPAGDDRADERRVGVEQRGDAEAAVVEAAVPGEGRAEVPDADEHDRPAAAEAEHAADLALELGDVVADAAGAVRAEVRQVLAQHGRADAGGRGERVAADGRAAVLGQRVQGPQVDRQPGDGGVGQLAPHARTAPRPELHGPRLRACERLHEVGEVPHTRRPSALRSRRSSMRQYWCSSPSSSTTGTLSDQRARSRRVGVDVPQGEGRAGVGRGPRDDRLGRGAQRAAVAGHQLDGRGGRPAAQPHVPESSRSRPLLTLPVEVCGSDATSSTAVGHLKRASERAQCAMSSSTDGRLPSRARRAP